MVGKNWLAVIVVLLTASCAEAAHAGRVISTVTHETVHVYSAGPGSSGGAFPQEMGVNGRSGDAVTSVPGVLSIVPGDRWSNFITAASEGIPYVVKSAVMEVHTGSPINCIDWLPERRVIQSGEANIRLWWPLAYESPGTVWILTILYGTADQWDDDGSGPHLPSHVHKEVWKWELRADLQSLKHALAVFRQMPFGASQVPLISDEALFIDLQRQVDVIQEAWDSEYYPYAGLQLLGYFEMTVMDACIANLPAEPVPSGAGTGIANSLENPACCKLLVDCEYISMTPGLPPYP